VSHITNITFFIDKRYISVPDYNEVLSDIIEVSRCVHVLISGLPISDVLGT